MSQASIFRSQTDNQMRRGEGGRRAFARLSQVRPWVSAHLSVPGSSLLWAPVLLTRKPGAHRPVSSESGLHSALRFPPSAPHHHHHCHRDVTSITHVTGRCLKWICKAALGLLPGVRGCCKAVRLEAEVGWGCWWYTCRCRDKSPGSPPRPIVEGALGRSEQLSDRQGPGGDSWSRNSGGGSSPAVPAASPLEPPTPSELSSLPHGHIQPVWLGGGVRQGAPVTVTVTRGRR